MNYGIAFFSLILIFVGIILIFWGYKSFKIIVPVLGFFFGFIFGRNLVQSGIINISGSPQSITIIMFIIAGLTGVVFALLGLFFYELGIAISLAAIAYLLINSILLALGMSTSMAYLISIIAGVGAFVITFILHLYKYLIIISTSTNGAYYLMAGILFLFPMSGAKFLFDDNSLQLGSVVQSINPQWQIIFILGFFIISAVGIFYQIRDTQYLD